MRPSSDSDLLDVLRLELSSMGLGVDFNWHLTREVVLTLSYAVPSPVLWKDGTFEYTELGYEDDTTIINECL